MKVFIVMEHELEVDYVRGVFEDQQDAEKFAGQWWTVDEWEVAPKRREILRQMTQDAQEWGLYDTGPDEFTPTR